LDNAEKPLAGKRIVVTRAPEQAQELVHALEQLGAQVILLPMVSFALPDDCQKLDEQLRHLDWFDAILFLSKNAVRYMFDRCAQLGIKCEMLQSSSRFVAAVGPATAEALKQKGIRVNYVAQKGTGEALARELRQSLAGRRVLLPRSDRGDERVPRALREVGANVTEVIAYRTMETDNLDADILARVRHAEINAVIFASPSAFQNFRSAIGEAELENLSPRVDFVAIGPTTAHAIRESGARLAVQAEEASAEGLARAIAKHYQHHSAAMRRA
jgi:uroporphyrinogen-III synthase